MNIIVTEAEIGVTPCAYWEVDSLPIDPPNRDRLPKCARNLVRAANARNRAREAPESYSIDDLIAAWLACGGYCAVSGMPLDLLVVGDGQAKTPVRAKPDRIDRHNPYQRDNVRLVVAVANFGTNAWG